MTLAYLCESEPTRQRWIVPDASLFAKEGWVDRYDNLDVRAVSNAASVFFSGTNATVHACRIVEDRHNPGGHYLYYLFTHHQSAGNRFFLRQVKLDKDDKVISSSNSQKQYTTFFLAGHPNNRMAFDAAKVKDFSISGNGRVLHIVYAHSATVWYDIYEYASADYSVSWIPENTNRIHAGLLNSAGNTFWKFSASNMQVAAALYNATAKTLQVRLFALTAGDHTNLTAQPAQTLEHTFSNVAVAPNGILLSDDMNQFVLLGNGEYTLCNMASASGSVFTAATQKVTDARFSAMDCGDWLPNDDVLWLSKESALAQPYRVMMHDARVDIEVWVVGPGGDGGPARSGTAPDGQTIYIGGSGGDGGEVVKADVRGLAPGTPLTIEVGRDRTRLVVAGKTITARKGAAGTANQGGEVSLVAGGLGNRYGNPGKGCQGSINPVGSVGGLGQSLDLNPFDGTLDPVQYGRGGGGGGNGGGQSGSLGGRRGTNDNVRDGQPGTDGKGDGGGGGRFNAPFGRGGSGGLGGVYVKVLKYLRGRPSVGQTHGEHTMHAFLKDGTYYVDGTSGNHTPDELNAIRAPVVVVSRLPLT